MKIYQVLLLVIMFISCKEESVIDKTKILPFYNTNEFTPQWISNNSKGYDNIHRIAPFSLTNQDGRVITNKNLEGSIYVADFFFTTCPSICPILAKNMFAIQEEFKNDDSVKLISHTVMPWVDSVEVLKEYATNKGVISNKWHLLTGDRDEIYDLARTSYFADEDFVKTKDESEFIHTENVLLIDKKGRIRGVYNGTLALETKRLIRHIETLKKER